MLRHSVIAALALVSLAGAAAAQSAKPSKRDALGCSDRSLQDRISTIANSGDREAFQKIATAGVMSGKCKVVKEGTALFLEDTALMSGLACFRPTGEVQCLWMPIDLTR